jgi:glycerate-2-kinase
MNDPREFLRDVFNAGLAAVDPYLVTLSQLNHVENRYHEGGFKRLYVVGFGKAACPMARAAEERLGGLIDGGIAVTKYGHSRDAERLRRITMFEAGHPLPDENGVTATRQAVDLIKKSDASTLLLCLISGGGSALFVLPLDGISLNDSQVTTDLLLKRGATINELNAVRKHLSKVKGGLLARIAYPATTISLILSDVIGDKLDVIASGTTAPDDSTYGEGLEILEKYGLFDEVPPPVREVFLKGKEGRLDETPKKGDPVFKRVDNRIIASNRIALAACEAKARRPGFHTRILSSQLQGEASKAATWLLSQADAVEIPKAGAACLIAGGETTVTVRGHGSGGRNTELALAFGIAASGRRDVALLSAGTDGTDGPTDAAGAFADGTTVQRGAALGMDAISYLANNDSYTYFSRTQDLLVTGPTGTNVMDIQILLVSPDRSK